MFITVYRFVEKCGLFTSLQSVYKVSTEFLQFINTLFTPHLRGKKKRARQGVKYSLQRYSID